MIEKFLNGVSENLWSVLSILDAVILEAEEIKTVGALNMVHSIINSNRIVIEHVAGKDRSYLKTEKE